MAALAVKAFGQLDGVVMNHGVLDPLKRLANSTVDDWKKHYDVNVFSALGLVSPLPHVYHPVH